MNTIDQIPAADLKGKRVLLRTSLNIPVDERGNVTDLFRLRRGLPTIQYLSECGARTIIVGYFGRKGDSMRPVADALANLAPQLPIHFLGSPLMLAKNESASLKDSECLVLENIRQETGEETNDPELCQTLASLADIMVSDSLAEAHRPYASNVGVASLMPHYAGFLLREEIKQLEFARNPAQPSFAVLGGAKFETKAPLISLLLEKYDKLFIAGALANDVYKARGHEVGRSLISAELPSQEILNNPRFVVPVDVTVETPDGQARTKKPEEVTAEDKIVDIGPDSIAHIAPLITQAKCILWNGPTGLYENGYVSWTHALAEIVSHAVANGSQAVIGGGDTIAAIQESGVSMDTIGFLSTGGGAMLEYLLKGSLPGIDAIAAPQPVVSQNFVVVS